MQRAYLAVLVALLGMVAGCDFIKSMMPPPSAKAVSVPVDAKAVALDMPDGITINTNAPGQYFVIESDTRNLVLVYTVAMGENARDAFSQRKGSLDGKRKYEVDYLVDPASTRPSANVITPSVPPTPPVAPTPPAPAPIQPSGNPLAPAPTPAQPSGNPLAPSNNPGANNPSP